MKKSIFTRWCSQCGKYHQTKFRRAVKCDDCKKKNFTELKFRRILRIPNYCYVDKKDRKTVSIISE